MTFDDIKAAIAAEGEVTVGNWTYAANDQLIKRFQDYVKTVYDVDITLNYVGSQSPSTYLADLYTAVQAGSEIALRRPGDRGELLGAGSDRTPKTQAPSSWRIFSPLAWSRMLSAYSIILKHSPTAIGFQSSATPGINYNRNNVDFLTDWKDLADERLKGSCSFGCRAISPPAVCCSVFARPLGLTTPTWTT